MTAHGIGGSRARGVWRALALAAILTAMLVGVTAGARATEEVAPGAAEEESLTYDELQQNASQRAQEFFPDPYVEPSFLQWLSLPTLAAGLVMTGLLLGAYLWWQPKFAAERRQKQRR